MNRSDSYEYDAFNWCTDKGSGWYLPSKDELKELEEYDYSIDERRIDAINSTLLEHGYPLLSGRYWSSTEDDHRDAYFVDVDDGYSSYSNKNNSYCIRAMYIIRNDSINTISGAPETVEELEAIECNDYYEDDYYEDDYEEVVDIGSER